MSSSILVSMFFIFSIFCRLNGANSIGQSPPKPARYHQNKAHSRVNVKNVDHGGVRSTVAQKPQVFPNNVQVTEKTSSTALSNDQAAALNSINVVNNAGGVRGTITPTKVMPVPPTKSNIIPPVATKPIHFSEAQLAAMRKKKAQQESTGHSAVQVAAPQRSIPPPRQEATKSDAPVKLPIKPKSNQPLISGQSHEFPFAQAAGQFWSSETVDYSPEFLCPLSSNMLLMNRTGHNIYPIDIFNQSFVSGWKQPKIDTFPCRAGDQLRDPITGRVDTMSRDHICPTQLMFCPIQRNNILHAIKPTDKTTWLKSHSFCELKITTHQPQTINLYVFGKNCL